MTLWGIGGGIVGTALLVTVLCDVFIVVLHHWGGNGPLGGRLIHRGWRFAVRMLRPVSAHRRRRVLGYVGPALIPATILLWAALTVLGFALLYFPHMRTAFRHGADVPEIGRLADALYFSGLSFFTIGYGDLVPATPGMRALSVMEGGSGFALVSLAISYFSSVYAGYSSQKSLAESVHAQAGESADAARIIANHLTGGAATGVLAGELARLRDGMAIIGSGYANYPILHFFVAAVPRESLLRLLFVIHDLTTLLDTVIDPDRCSSMAGMGHRSGLEATARNLRRSLAATLLEGWDRAARQADYELEAGDPFGWAVRFGRAAETLREAGVPVREDAASRLAYVRARGEWEPWLRASAEVLGESWNDICGGF